MKPFLPLLGVTSLAAAALIGTTGCQSTADANTHRIAGGTVPIFHKLDANNDGKVTYAEFDAGFADSVLDTYDKDGDGVVTRAEWNAIEAANQDTTKASFAALDRNHDGKLTRDELNHHGARRNAVVKQVFARIDKNGDGVITEDEARTYGIRRAVRPRPGQPSVARLPPAVEKGDLRIDEASAVPWSGPRYGFLGDVADCRGAGLLGGGTTCFLLG